LLSIGSHREQQGKRETESFQGRLLSTTAEPGRQERKLAI
jgi:hypothetical protein